MKRILSILVALAFASAAAYAGCGKKVASVGKLENYDAASKTLTIAVIESSAESEVKSKKATLTLTPDTKVIYGDKVADVKVEDLVGKNVSVVSEHGKVDFVIVLSAKG